MSYISRQALLEKLKYMGDFNICIDYVTAEDIMSVPSADVRENVHGEWIPKERMTDCSVAIDIVCSECGYVGIEDYAYGYELDELPVQEMKDYIKKFDLNFCPCCGAKIDKGVSE